MKKIKSIIIKLKVYALFLIAVISAAGFYGCNDSNNSVVVPVTADNVGLNAVGSTDSAGDSQNYFILDTVKILIKDIKLNVANSNQDSTNFKTGPFVLYINTFFSVNEISTALIPAGSYDKIKFEIHKLNNNEVSPDPEFSDANGTYSVIVKGWYLGNYFVYKSSKSAHQMINFSDTIPLETGARTNITLVVKPYIWFIKNNVYMDPNVPANSNDIDNNIKDNFKNNLKAFRDNDKNGVPD